MKQHDRPRWGLLHTLDVLLDVCVLAAIAFFTVDAFRSGRFVAAGCGAASGLFVLGGSLVVRGAIVPTYRERRAARNARWFG